MQNFLQLQGQYLPPIKPLHCLQAINVKNVIILRGTIHIFCPPKHSYVLTNWCPRRYKIPRSNCPPFHGRSENLLTPTIRTFIFWTYTTLTQARDYHTQVCVTKNSCSENTTSNRYFSPLWEVRLTQEGPQPHFGPHSNTTSFASINLEGITETNTVKKENEIP